MDLYQYLTSCCTSQAYWYGPYNVLVPNHIDSIKAKDGYNILFKDGNTTNKQVPKHITKQQYLSSYTELVDGKYYWKEENSKYWEGPYGVLVPIDVEYIVAIDGINTLCQDGTQTNHYYSKPLTKWEYRSRYARLEFDFNYYYTE